MKNLLYILFVVSLISCQIEDDNAPQPDDGFIKYYGSLAEQEAVDIEPVWNADSSDIESFVILGTQQLEGQSKDYFVALADASGNLVNSNSFGFRNVFQGVDVNNDGMPDTVEAQDVAGQIAIIPSGYVVVGTSSISATSTNFDIVDLEVMTYAFLDQDLNVIGRVQRRIGELDIPADIQLDLFGNDILQLSDGSFLVAGAKESSTDLDFYAIRFGVQPDTIYWEETYGLKGGGLDDVFVRAFERDNQNIAFFGYSQDFGDNGERGTNVTFLEVNTNGNVVRSNSTGIEDDPIFDFNDVLTDVVEKPGGYLAVGTSTVNDLAYSFFMDIDDNGLSSRKDTLSSEFTFNGERLQTMALGVTTSRTNDFVIVGQYPSFRTDDASRDGAATRGGEAMFMRINQVGEKVAGFENNYGLGDGNDAAVDAVVLPDGKIVVLGTIDFGGGVKLISLIKLNDTGQIDQ